MTSPQLHTTVLEFCDSLTLLSAVRVCRRWQLDAMQPGAPRALDMRTADVRSTDLRFALVAPLLGRLTSISFESIELGAAAFETLATQCATLHTISVQRMRLSASAFRAIASMAQLRRLDLSHSSVSGGWRCQRLKWENQVHRYGAQSRSGAVFTTRTVMFAPGAGTPGCAFLPCLTSLVLHRAETCQRAVLSRFTSGTLRPPTLLLKRCAALTELSLSQWSSAEIDALDSRAPGAAPLTKIAIHDARLSSLGLQLPRRGALLTQLVELTLDDVDIRPGRWARRPRFGSGGDEADLHRGHSRRDAWRPGSLLASIFRGCRALRSVALVDIEPSFGTPLKCARALRAWGEALPQLRAFKLAPAAVVRDVGVQALLEGCRGLTTLNLPGAVVGNASLRALGRCARGLRALYLGFSIKRRVHAMEGTAPIDDVGIAVLVEHCRELSVLHVSVGEAATRRGLARLSNEFTAMRDLRVRTCLALGARAASAAPQKRCVTVGAAAAVGTTARTCKCGAAVATIDWEDHTREVCALSERLCPAGCGARLVRGDANALSIHFTVCPAYVVVCPARACSRVLHRSALAAHMHAQHSETTERERDRLCPLWGSGCCVVINGSVSPGAAREAHTVASCAHNIVVCPSCSCAVHRCALVDGTHARICDGPKRRLALISQGRRRCAEDAAARGVAWGRESGVETSTEAVMRRLSAVLLSASSGGGGSLMRRSGGAGVEAEVDGESEGEDEEAIKSFSAENPLWRSTRREAPSNADAESEADATRREAAAIRDSLPAVLQRLALLAR